MSHLDEYPFMQIAIAQKLEPVPWPGIPVSQHVVDIRVVNMTARI